MFLACIRLLEPFGLGSQNCHLLDGATFTAHGTNWTSCSQYLELSKTWRSWWWALSDVISDLLFAVFGAVPCYKRVKQVDSHQENFEKLIEVEGDEDGGWVDTHHFAGNKTFLTQVWPRPRLKPFISLISRFYSTHWLYSDFQSNKFYCMKQRFWFVSYGIMGKQNFYWKDSQICIVSYSSADCSIQYRSITVAHMGLYSPWKIVLFPQLDVVHWLLSHFSDTWAFFVIRLEFGVL